jgi:acyl carrier protein
MMRAEIEEEVRRFILDEVLEEGDATELPENVALLSGLLDSFGLMSLIGFLEERYDITIAHDQVVNENFRSVEAVAAFVESQKMSASQGVG